MWAVAFFKTVCDPRTSTRVRAAAGGRRGEEGEGVENSQIPTLPGKSPKSSQALSFPAHEILCAGAKWQVHGQSAGDTRRDGSQPAHLRGAAPAPHDPALRGRRGTANPSELQRPRSTPRRVAQPHKPPTVKPPDAAALPVPNRDTTCHSFSGQTSH